jgi:hypothetical protein
MRLFVSGFYVKQLLLVPLDILKNNFDFNTKTEELFDFKGDSPVYSQPGRLDSPLYLPSSFDSPGIHLRGVSTPRCIHCRGVENPRCGQHRV